MQVYIEYAIIDNLVINYLILKTASASVKVKTNFLRLFISSCLGTAVAVVLPLFTLNERVLLFVKVLLAFIMPLIISKYANIKNYFSVVALFILFTFLCGGFILALLSFAVIDYKENYILSYDSVLPIGLSVLIVYALSKTMIKLSFIVLKERNLQPFLRRCIIVIGKTKYKVLGFIDSGNGLYDKKTGLPIIVASNSFFSKIPKSDIKKSISNFEFDTVSGTSYMNLYVIDKVMIYNGEKVNIFNNVLLGVSSKVYNFTGYEILLHPALGG